MGVFHELRIKARHIALPVVAACLVGYFVYHLVEGERGLRTWLRLQQKLAAAEASEADLARARARLERRVALLRPDSLDLDLLDERAHDVLNYGRADELIIFLPETPGGSLRSFDSR
ncbi:MAG: septum formation initiator family protein [Alphaproteobacteria bacterium]|nr:MAG: septum formation initiator family protein [Alphaproteobacteria bacterium]